MRFTKLPFVAAASVVGIAVLCSLSAAGCTANIHDNTADVHDNQVNIDNAKVTFSSSTDVDHLKPSDPITVTVKAENVYLIEPGETPTPDRVKVAGHFQFYLDDFGATPLLITAKEGATVTLPANVKEGTHKLKCRVHKHDGTPTAATFEITITITITVGPVPDAGSGTD